VTGALRVCRLQRASFSLLSRSSICMTSCTSTSASRLKPEPRAPLAAAAAAAAAAEGAELRVLFPALAAAPRREAATAVLGSAAACAGRQEAAAVAARVQRAGGASASAAMGAWAAASRARCCPSSSTPWVGTVSAAALRFLAGQAARAPRGMAVLAGEQWSRFVRSSAEREGWRVM